MAAKNCPETPRQKMIAMLYITFVAMLALNVSANVLDGFTMVNNSLRSTLATAETRNAALHDQFEWLYEQNPQKVGEWLGKAVEVRAVADSIFDFIEEMKWEIARAADRTRATTDPNNMVAHGNLDAAGEIGITRGRGTVLRDMMGYYSEFLRELVGETNPTLAYRVEGMFATEDEEDTGRTWEQRKFQFMPAVAAVTVLTKIQNDIRNAEADVVQELIRQVDAGDLRVNEINAVVIPNSRTVVRGGQFVADIILSARDSTRHPIVTVGGRELEGGRYVVPATSIGVHRFSGRIELPSLDGTEPRFFTFEDSFEVTEPAVTISADMMNLLYAGFENPISISVPGIPSSAVNATMTNGTLQRTARGWVARPARVGVESMITVTANIDGRTQAFPPRAFRVRALPPPVAFIPFRDADGNLQKYRGLGRPIPRRALLDAPGVAAELEDSDLDVRHTVRSFEVHIIGTMGTQIELSDGNRFSDRQRAAIDRLARGARFFIMNTRAVGPDGIERTLPAIDVTIG